MIIPYIPVGLTLDKKYAINKYIEGKTASKEAIFYWGNFYI